MKNLLCALLTAISLFPSFTQAQMITTIAGNGTGSYSGDGGPATSATMTNPVDVTKDKFGNLYICVDDNNCIRKINTSGIISTFAGRGSVGFAGDGGAATAALMYNPTAVTVDSTGNVYIADPNNHRVRKVNLSGIITTYAGNGSAGFSGDGGQATNASMYTPIDVAFDQFGNLFVAEADNHIIRKISPSGIISTVAGTPRSSGYSGDGGSSLSAQLNYPTGIVIDTTTGALFIADQRNHRVRVMRSGNIYTYAGTGTASFSGDGGPATAATLKNPTGVDLHPSGQLIVSDYGNNRVRIVNASGSIATIAGTGAASYSGDGGPATAADLINYRTFTESSGLIYSAGSTSHRVRRFSIDCAGSTPTITGRDTVCKCALVNLIGSPAGGSWSANNGSAFVSTTGNIIGYSLGRDTINYTINSSVCGSMSAHKVILVSNCTQRVQEVSNIDGSIVIYPNPGEDIFTLYAKFTIYRVAVMDITGNELMTLSSSSKEVKLDLTQFTAGIYLVKVNDFYTYKLIKE